MENSKKIGPGPAEHAQRVLTKNVMAKELEMLKEKEQSRRGAVMDKVDYAKVMKVEPDWLDQQCDKVFAALEGLTLSQKLGVVGQVSDYLQQEHVAGENDDN